MPAAANAPPKYDAFPVAAAFKNDKEIKDKQRLKEDIVKGRTTFTTKPVEDYYVGYILPRLSNVDNPTYANAVRQEVNSDLYDMERKLNDTDRLAVIDKLFQYFKYVTTKNYTPAAKINAYLILGELNEMPAGRGNTPPKPYGNAMSVLYAGATDATTDGERAAALVGLERHIKLTFKALPENMRNQAAAKLLEAAKMPPRASQSVSSHAWLTSRYLELMSMFEHSLGNEVTAFALDTLANEHTDPILRERALLIVGRHAPIEIPKGKLINAGRYSMRYLKRSCEDWKQNYNLSATAGSDGGSSAYAEAAQAESDLYAKSQSSQDSLNPYGPTQKEKPERKENPYEKQDAQTKMLRRYLHQLSQTVKLGFAGVQNGEMPPSPTQGLLAKFPDGDERKYMMEAFEALTNLQNELDSESITKKSDLGKEVAKRVDTLIDIAADYPGAIDLENEPIIEEAPEAAAPAEVAGEIPAAADPAVADATVGIKPAPAPAPATAQ